MGRWSLKYHWQERGAVYDAQLAADRGKADAAAERQYVAMWKQRGRDEREKKFQQGDRLTDAADFVLKLPPVEQRRVDERYEDGREKTVHVLKPVRRDASVRLYESGQRMKAESIQDVGGTSASEIREVDCYQDEPYEPDAEA
jgi:hypothetical protein